MSEQLNDGSGRDSGRQARAALSWTAVWRGRLGRLWVFLAQSFSSVARHQTLTMASALAFSTLTATVPMLLIGIAVASAFGTEDGHSYTDLFILSIQERLPDTPQLQPLMAILRGISTRSGEIAGIGLALLFITAYSLLSSTEYAFNRIWQVTAHRGFFNRAVAYLATIVLVPVLMAFSVYFSARVETVARKFADTIEQDGIRSLFPFSPADTPVTPPESPASDMPAGAEATPGMVGSPGSAALAQRQADFSLPLPSPELFELSAAPAPAPPALTASTAGEEAQTLQNVPVRQSLTLKILLGALSLLFTCFALTLLLHFMPYTPVRWRAAICGGVFSGVLVELLKYTFSYYAQNATANLTRLYGTTMLAFPLALLWLWLIWVIILLGAEVAFNLQNYRDLAASAEIEKNGLRNRLYLAVRTVLVASERFHTGANPAGLIGEAAQRLNVPEFAIRSIVQQLVEKNVLRPVKDLEEAFLPGRDISALSLLTVVEAVAGDTFTCPAEDATAAHRLLADLFGETTQQLAGQFGTLTMLQLLEREGFCARSTPPAAAPLD